MEWLRRSDKPILAGPFRGEVGFESLYWIPYLAALCARARIAPGRLIPITRGGAGFWYGHPTHVELYGMRTPQEVRVENRIQQQATGQLKQTHVTPFDRAVLADAAETLGLRHRRDYHVLHPAWMYQTLNPFFTSQFGLGWLQSHVIYPPIAPPVVQGLTLPEAFVAVRFYFRATFPANPANIAFATHTIQQVAAQHPVVILNSGLHLDDHMDFLPDLPNVTVLSQMAPMTAENNLAVQSAVLGRALGFVGTYGGMAQLALRMGKPSVSVYDHWHGTALAHLHVSQALAQQSHVAFSVQRIADLPLQQSVLPQVRLSPTA